MRYISNVFDYLHGIYFTVFSPIFWKRFWVIIMKYYKTKLKEMPYFIRTVVHPAQYPSLSVAKDNCGWTKLMTFPSLVLFSCILLYNHSPCTFPASRIIVPGTLNGILLLSPSNIHVRTCCPLTFLSNFCPQWQRLHPDLSVAKSSTSSTSGGTIFNHFKLTHYSFGYPQF